MARTTAGGMRPSTGQPGGEPGPQIGRRDVEARDADVLDPPPVARRLRVLALALDHHDRGEIPGLVEPPPRAHVGDRVGAEHEEQLVARAARATPSVSAVTDAPSRSTSTADASTPSTSAIASSTSARRSRADATTRPRFCHGSPAGTTSTRSSPSRQRTSAATTTCPTCTGIERAPEHPEALWSSPGTAAVYERALHGPVTPAKHSGHLRSYDAVMNECDERPRPRLAPRPTGCARSRGVADRCRRRRHRRHRRPRAGRERRRRRVRGAAAQRERARPHGARDRRGRRRERRGGARSSTTSPTRGSTRSNRPRACAGRSRSASCTRSS